MDYQTKKFMICDLPQQYQKAKKTFGICNETNKGKILVQGANAINLINHFLTIKINEDTVSRFCLLHTKHCFLDEVLVLRINYHKYVLIVNEYKKVFKSLKRSLIKHPLTIINNVTDSYAYFTFHGMNANKFFSDKKGNLLFKTTHQKYQYYHMLAPKKDEITIFNQFLSLKFIPISLETKKIFLYNNKVITNFKALPRKFRKLALNCIYHLNPKDKTNYTVEVFEVLDSLVIPTNNNILNHKRDKCGIICSSFRLPNKKFPFVVGLVENINGSLLITKNEKKEILIRKLFKAYETF